MISNTNEWRPKANPWLITGAVMAATIMEVLDTSVANVALNHIAGNLSAALCFLYPENPPYLKNTKPGRIDYVGFGLLTLWIGCLQVMLDKGQDADWFSSTFIRVLARHGSRVCILGRRAGRGQIRYQPSCSRPAQSFCVASENHHHDMRAPKTPGIGDCRTASLVLLCLVNITLTAAILLTSQMKSGPTIYRRFPGWPM